MKCYILEWYPAPQSVATVKEYYRMEIAAMNRQKELEQWARILCVNEFVMPTIKEILIHE